LLAGACGAALGFCALASAGPSAAHLLLFLIGLGIGAGLTAGNVIVGTIDEAGEDCDKNLEPLAAKKNSSRSRLLALLNLSWGLGAIACSLWLRGSVRLNQLAGNSIVAAPASRTSAVFFLGLAAAFAGMAALLAWLLPRRYYRRDKDNDSQSKMEWRAVAAFVASLALYVGVENALAGWLPIYAQRLSAGAVLSGRAAEIALCFWVFELIGRGLTALLAKRIDERIFYRACLAALIAAIGLLVMSPRLDAQWTFGLTAAVAISLSPIFPLAVSFLLARVGSDPGVGRIFASASLGGTLLPWLTGVGSTHFQSLRLGFVVPATGAALILLLSWYLPATRAASRLPLKVFDR
jgi:fucose permease